MSAIRQTAPEPAIVERLAAPESVQSAITAPDWSLAVGLFSVGMFIELLLAHRLSKLGAFALNNVIFDADVKLAFTEAGKFTHPLLGYMFSVPLRILAAAATSLGLASDQVAFRQAVALYVSPFMFGLKAAVDFIVFRLLRLGRGWALGGALCGAAAFSSVIFGATPDSYAASGCAFSILTLLVITQSRGLRRPVATRAWLAAAAVTVGITISNVIQVGAMALARVRFWSEPKLRALISAAAAAAITLVAVVLLGLLLRTVHGNESHFGEFVQRFTPTRFEQMSHLARFPEILGRSFIATAPEKGSSLHGLREGQPVPLEFTYNARPFDTASAALWMFGAALMAGGIVLGIRRQGIQRDLMLSATLAVFTFGILYGFFGLNTFLYSQYWQAPATLLIAGWLVPADDRSWSRASIVTVFVALMLVRDWIVVTDLEHRIAAAVAATAAH